MARKLIKADASSTTSKDAPSKSAEELWAEEWLAERTKPSRQRNLTPSQRKQRLGALRLCRAGRSEATRAAILKRGVVVVIR